MDRLTPETRQKVCIENAQNFYWKAKNNVEKQKIRKYPKLSELRQKLQISQ